MLRPTCCIGRARESIRYYVLGGWVGSFWPWWPFWRSSLDVAFVAIGFTNFEQPGESGFFLQMLFLVLTVQWIDAFCYSCLGGEFYNWSFYVATFLLLFVFLMAFSVSD